MISRDNQNFYYRQRQRATSLFGDEILSNAGFDEFNRSQNSIDFEEINKLPELSNTGIL